MIFPSASNLRLTKFRNYKFFWCWCGSNGRRSEYLAKKARGCRRRLELITSEIFPGEDLTPNGCSENHQNLYKAALWYQRVSQPNEAKARRGCCRQLSSAASKTRATVKNHIIQPQQRAKSINQAATTRNSHYICAHRRRARI